MSRPFYVPPWRVEISVRRGVREIASRTSLARLAATALTAAGAPGPASLALILSDDRELAALNAEHMGESGPTDVLSFPMLPPPSTDRPAEPSYELPPGQRAHLGDIVVSVERAVDQAPDSPIDELRQLVVHGVLHICGWDHADPVERHAMRALERDILTRARRSA